MHELVDMKNMCCRSKVVCNVNVRMQINIFYLKIAKL